MNEIIYVLINEAMPGYVKVGITTNLEQRIRSLDTTSVPLPFEVFYAATVQDSKFVERQIFEAFLDKRVRSSREFFQISPEQAVAIIKLVEIENVTPKQDFVENQEDQKALNEARTRRSAFNFKMVNVPVGAELSFAHDPEIKSTVADNKMVMFENELMSLSGAAQKILDVEWPVQGPLYWIYEGETLDERRRKMEEE
ncbi:GIY-YIG nuclease family protein [Candidatus Parcubacteria bacterium]|nr:GIY-YIG nuclease family protein [Candidatus Parcubacteria bacterium]